MIKSHKMLTGRASCNHSSQDDMAELHWEAERKIAHLLVY